MLAKTFQTNFFMITSKMMKKVDIIFTIFFGILLGFLISDFLHAGRIYIGPYYSFLLWISLALFSLLCLWVSHIIGKKLLFVLQAAKHLLVGGFATIVDLKFFELLLWIFSAFVIINPVILKGISFLVATLIKYFGNKYWAFQKNGTEKIHKEVGSFFVVTLVGVIIDVGCFYYFVKIMGPQFSINMEVWLKLSVIFAAIIAALWNFLGYKFLVFKN
ncbi:MAG: hypothetical protein A3D34_00915 [Candidatus Staskawiczbacteria bacterium RIFCSPHIGHO2_02_FULL_33_16]|uniref:GtrA/DPMS transmembrane domain-containing protein n=1 Tax=Candidatus Staskawiczbacteria bacterium RIFCSPHIGHO2_02_FULL_33_16 TaxID=1802204 RepID=A0A1G2HUV9_9BACT|nr:MAG: hypothetical protein A3D34_00915 [Candidatus Staskawiczbacteria bacterium RIFCSPHIGHO2_02_FULL_33_16]OGZ70694.1 MAG: hypothetical protein A2980_01850 [Candidatus Staskawiczbacteria bacterium RIFCSPLOWO2_01_FULL_33_13]